MDASQAPQRVAAADFIRGFASWRLRSARKPVVVTHHGKDAHVLISLDDYRRLGGAGATAPDSSQACLRDSQILLLESIRDGLILIDRQHRIAAINPAASDMLEVAAARLIGEPLTAALPSIQSSLIFHHIVRMIDHRERFSGDLPSLLRPGQWLHVDLIPSPLGGALILRDVSDTIAALAHDGARQAAIRAIDIDGSVGHAGISVRGAIDFANASLTGLIGVDESAIRRVRFSALLALARRQAFVEALEEVFRTGTPTRIESDLVAREGTALPVTLSIVERRSAYASDGAVILVTQSGAG